MHRIQILICVRVVALCVSIVELIVMKVQSMRKRFYHGIFHPFIWKKRPEWDMPQQVFTGFLVSRGTKTLNVDVGLLGFDIV
jgi:hypothetical protein